MLNVIEAFLNNQEKNGVIYSRRCVPTVWLKFFVILKQKNLDDSATKMADRVHYDVRSLSE